jgi:hypothetical protein
MEKDISSSKEEPVSRAVIIVWTFIALFFSSFLFFALYELYIHSFTLAFICSIILLAGLVIEFKTICRRWDRVIITGVIAMGTSWVAFLPIDLIGIQGCLRIWPFFMCGAFGIATMWSFSGRSQIKLTEGITFMQCLALLYWMIDGISGSSLDNLTYLILGIVLITSSYAVYHAFTYSELTRKTRFILSFWSATIMTFFASLNIYAVYQMQRNSEGSDIIITMLQHFILGISSIYIVQNIYLIVGYFPSEDWKDLKDYGRNRRKLTTLHILRFSDQQVRLKQILICFIICSLMFGVNYFMDIVPPNLAIWFAFILVPIALKFFEEKAKNKTENSPQ